MDEFNRKINKNKNCYIIVNNIGFDILIELMKSH